MKTFVKTVIGGALGFIALYAVGHVAYQTGRDMAKAECRYRALSQPNRDAQPIENLSDEEGLLEEENTAIVMPAAPVHKPSRMGIFAGMRKLFARKQGVLGKLMQHPEQHQVEAFIEGSEIHVNVKPRAA